MVNMSKMEGNDPINDYKVIREELSKYSKKLANKKEIIVASKMDMPDSKDNLIEFKKAYPDKDIFEISSITHFGIDDLLNNAKLSELIHKNKVEEERKSRIIWVLAVIGAVAAVAGIAYAVYRFFTPDYLEDFEDDFDDDFDDYFEDEDGEEN